MDNRHRDPVAIADFDTAFDASFSLVAFIMNRHLIDHMLRATRLLTDGDYEALILWGILVHQNVAHLMPPGTLAPAVLNERGRLASSYSGLRPMLLRDLSAIAGIPRETARRKLERLASMGYIERSGRAWVIAANRIEPDLREFTRESVRRLLAAADEVRAVLHERERAAARPR